MEPLLPDQVTGQVTTVVDEADTAQTMGSGDVPVLSTPRVLALAEAATMAALTRRIPTRLSTVGIEATLRHVRAVPVGDRVIAKVVLRQRDGSRLTFDFSLTTAEADPVADGSIVRQLVDREDFLARVRGDAD
ncbi:putative thioesterase [Stackebrandtia endophytica]|uniref:Putative thioesterase n=1 Tax=Stackebrandtia endophytica TaxID=1496996 RepID=A0A543AQU9_9ACTN|nr:putative thioesterase [Stackebrandtia endophytica]